MNSNMVKPEKLDHLHLVYHFTVPLNNDLKKTLTSWLFIGTWVLIQILAMEPKKSVLSRSRTKKYYLLTFNSNSVTYETFQKRSGVILGSQLIFPNGIKLSK